MKPLSYDHIPPFYAQTDESSGVNVIIETPRGSRQKFAYKEEYGVIELRRILRGGMVWPCDFGFVPQTLGEDGDALDIALLLDEPCFPGCLVRARLLGAIGLRKNGEENDRILACPISLPGSGSHWDEVRTLDDISPRTLREIEAFLTDYQTFEGHHIELTGIRNHNDAIETVRRGHEVWKAKQRS
ncbi:MAG TPA: inorganic diphosphatase [Abditibacteriaceae bacterium]